MVDNQHKLIAGYRDLTQAEIALINEWKQIELLLDTQLNQLEVRHTAQGRWNAMARTHLETGVMYAIKALACPQGGLGNPERQPPVSQESTMGATKQQQLEELDREHREETPEQQFDEALEKVNAKEAAQARQQAADEAYAKERQRRVHEDRQRHGFDPYAAKAERKPEDG